MRIENEYLIGMIYHYPDDYDIWKKGYVEDYEAATAVFIKAKNSDNALEWGYKIATALLNHINGTSDLTLEQFQHHCWYIAEPSKDDWRNMLDSFQHVDYGQMPDFEEIDVRNKSSYPHNKSLKSDAASGAA